MFVKIVKNVKGTPNTSFAYLVEAYREDGKVKHRIIKKFGLIYDDQIPYLKAMYARNKPKLVYDGG